jgi:hypothetical protein
MQNPVTFLFETKEVFSISTVVRDRETKELLGVARIEVLQGKLLDFYRNEIYLAFLNSNDYVI